MGHLAHLSVTYIKDWREHSLTSGTPQGMSDLYADFQFRM